jgi:serine/threonine protein kinase
MKSSSNKDWTSSPKKCMEKIFTCDDVKKVSNGMYGRRLIKIMPKKFTLTNNMRKVEVASEAYHNFVANDIEGVHQLVDYLESKHHVFFVYFVETGRTMTLQKVIQTKYGEDLGSCKYRKRCGKNREYGRTVLNIFKIVATTAVEMYNHGIVHESPNSENVLINMNTLKPLITNFKHAREIRDDVVDWKNLVRCLGSLLYELWTGQLPECDENDFKCELLDHEDSEVPPSVKNFITKTLAKSSCVTKIDFHNLLETLP